MSINWNNVLKKDSVAQRLGSHNFIFSIVAQDGNDIELRINRNILIILASREPKYCNVWISPGKKYKQDYEAERLHFVIEVGIFEELIRDAKEISQKSNSILTSTSFEKTKLIDFLKNSILPKKEFEEIRKKRASILY